MKFKKEITVGLVIGLGLVLLVLGVNYLKGINLFKENRNYYSVYERVDGIVEANPVLLNGYKVGQVSSVTLHPDNSGKWIVEFNIDNEDLKIPEGTIARIISSDLLGSKAVDLVLGENENYLEVGDTLDSEIQATLTEEFNKTLEPLRQKTNKLLGSIDTMVQVVTAVIDDESFQNLDKTFSASIADIRSAIKSFERTAFRLDTLIARESGRISSILSNADAVTQNLKNNNENITRIIENLGNISDTLSNADVAGTINQAKDVITSLSGIVEKVNKGEGSLGELVKSDSLVNSLRQTNEEVQRLIENIKEHPNRYLQFSIFGRKNKGLKMDARDEKKLKKFVRDSL